MTANANNELENCTCTFVNFLGIAGDIFSGESVIVAVDPHTFIIEWGCTKVSTTGQRCDDPWVSVHTRERFPSPKVLAKVDLALMQAIGVRLADLPRLSHANMRKFHFLP